MYTYDTCTFIYQFLNLDTNVSYLSLALIILYKYNMEIQMYSPLFL